MLRSADFGIAPYARSNSSSFKTKNMVELRSRRGFAFRALRTAGRFERSRAYLDRAGRKFSANMQRTPPPPTASMVGTGTGTSWPCT